MSIRKTYELLDHTADIGIRATAPTPEGVIAAMTEGFCALIGELVTTGDPQEVRWHFEDEDRAVLIRDYLTEALHLFESRRQVIADLSVEQFDEKRLVVVGSAFSIDEERSSYDQEIKAVTYHGLAFREIDGGYQAEVIVDV